jgi:hypothetical protein
MTNIEVPMTKEPATGFTTDARERLASLCSSPLHSRLCVSVG